MPTYDYQCDSCEAQFEASQSIHDDPLKDCPHCHQPRLRRLISGAGIIFKGGGFYVNDSKAPSNKSGGAESSPQADKPKAESPKKSEATAS
ncbi:MAG: zinc ribbon domain-containing protein [Spirochaetota bacterium]